MKKYIVTRVSCHAETVDIVGVYDDYYTAEAEMHVDITETIEGWEIASEGFPIQFNTEVEHKGDRFFWRINDIDIPTESKKQPFKSIEDCIVQKVLAYRGLIGEPEIGLDEEKRMYILSDYHDENAFLVEVLCPEHVVNRTKLISLLDRAGICYSF